MNSRNAKGNFIHFQIAKLRGDFETIKHCFILLSRGEISRLRLVSFAQLLLAFLDFAGVIAIGLIGMLSVYGIQSRSPSGQLKYLLDALKINDWSLQGQVTIVGLFAGIVLITKSVISAWINRRTIQFLSNRSADISIRILRKLAFSNLEQIKRRSRFENIYAITNGVQSVTVGVIGTMVNLFADTVLITVMFFGLLIIDPSIALATVTLFGLIAFTLYKLVNERVVYLAKEDANIQIDNGRLLYELFGSYREIFAGGIRKQYVDRLELLRRRGAKISASATFIRDISKYVLEVAFVFGALFFVGLQFILKDAVGAISSISIFVASAGRIIPAILRVQSSALTFRGAMSSASRTLDMIQELGDIEYSDQENSYVNEKQNIFSGPIKLNDVDFGYSDGSDLVIKDINLEIPPGEWLAVVGPSGAGKTTLVDLLLGILKPTRGTVEISGTDAETAVSKWPGMVSYVPQDSFIVQASIQENVALGRDYAEIDKDRVMFCLELVGLVDLVENNSKGTEFDVGELGSKLSGGQRQRLGIARALYSNPKLLILDEATSALDTSSEKKIVDCLSSIKGEVTIVSIAHRLSTVVNADRVIYVENGRIVASGSFQEVRNQVPNFDSQAKLANI